MKKIISLLIILFFSLSIAAQVSRDTPVTWVASNPSTCSPTKKSTALVYNYVAFRFYICVQTNVYQAIDSSVPTLDLQTANKVYAGATSGGSQIPAFRLLVAADIPALDAGKVTTGTFIASQIPSLDAAKTTTGTFGVARIPNLPTSILTSGTMDTARLGSGSATSSTFLLGDSTWAAAVKPTATRLERDLNDDYSNNLTTAVSSIAATETVLNCTQPVTVSASVTLPKNIKFRATRECLITVAASQALTIGTFVDPGNTKVFTSSASNAKVLFSKGAVEKINIAWWVGNTSGATITDALGEALESANAQQGIIHFPTGQWLTTGAHTISDGVTLEGEGNFPSAGYGTQILLSSPSTTYLFRIGEGEYGIRFKDLMLDGTGTTSKIGVYLTGQCPGTSGDISFTNVTISAFYNGVEIFSDDVTGPPSCNGWQVAQVQFTSSIFQSNTNAGIKTNSINGQITTTSTNFTVPASAWAVDCASCGILTINGSEFAGTATTKTFTDGNVTTGTDNIAITAHGFSANDEVYLSTTGVLPVTSPALSLTNKFVYVLVIDANNIKLSATSGGAAIDITTAAGGGTHSIIKLTSGVMKVSGAHPPINIIGSQDEGFKTFLQNDASDISGVINLDGNLIQSKIRLNESCRINSRSNNYRANSWRSTSPDSSIISSIGDYVNTLDLVGGTITAYLMDTASTGGANFSIEENSMNYLNQNRTPTQFINPVIYDAQPTIPIVGIGHLTVTSEINKPLLRLGRMVTDGVFDHYYDFSRTNSGADAGRLKITGSQTGFVGMDFNGDIRPTAVSMSGSTALTSSATIALDAAPLYGNIYTLTPAHTATINLTNPKAGKPLWLYITTSGTTSYTLTFGTNFRSAGTLATGTVDAKIFLVKFLCVDGTNFVEESRTVAL